MSTNALKKVSQKLVLVLANLLSITMDSKKAIPKFNIPISKFNTYLKVELVTYIYYSI